MSDDWEAYTEALDTVIDAGLRLPETEAEIHDAHEQFDVLCGKAFADEPCFDRRELAFQEWFVVGRPTATGATPFELVSERNIADSTEARIRQSVRRLCPGELLVGQVKKLKDNQLHANPVGPGDRLSLRVGSTVGIERGSIVVGRTYLFDDRLHLSAAAEFISPEHSKLFVKEAKFRGLLDRGADVMWQAAMRFRLFRERYASARADELIERWGVSLAEAGI